MANFIKGSEAPMKGLSFLDWEGLSEEEFHHLDNIINSTDCTAVKLPFSPPKREGSIVKGITNDQPKQLTVENSISILSSNENNPTSRVTDSTNSGTGIVFQPHIPPPPHHPPTIPPVMAYQLPVPHWAPGAPHTQGPPPPHYPMSHMQGGYVFQNQPPPSIVTNADAATIAFVAAMSAGQPIYAIPGVPIQSIHEHYPGNIYPPQGEPIDLSVPVLATHQPVTIPHFVQSDQMVFSHHNMPHVGPPPVIPLTNGVHHSIPPLTTSHQINHIHPSDSHIVYMPQENPPSSEAQESNAFLEMGSDEPLPSHDPRSSFVGSQTYRDTSQTGSLQNTSSHVPHSTTAFEFVGPDVFNAETCVNKEINVVNKDDIMVESISIDSTNNYQVSEMSDSFQNNTTVGSEKQVSSVNKIIGTAESNLDSVNAVVSVKQNPQSVDQLQTESKLKHTEIVEEKPISHIKKASSKVINNSYAHDIDKDAEQNILTVHTCDNLPPQPSTEMPSTSQSSPQPPPQPKMWSSLFGKTKSTTNKAYTNVDVSTTISNGSIVSPTSPSSELTNSSILGASVPTVNATVNETKGVRYWQEREKADLNLNSFVPRSQKVVSVKTQNDPLAPKILYMLSNLPVVHTPLVIQPRGLVNGSNVCFMNATLQVLMGCPPFIHLFRSFKNLPPRQSNGSCTPIFDALVEFANSFQNGQRIKSQGSRNKKGAHLDISVGQPFSPASLLNVAQDILGLRIGIQHDAEEFLSKILMLCHEELENVMKLNQSNVLNNNNEKPAANNGYTLDYANDEQEDESWQKVGPKNHHVETNVNDCGQTPLSSIFSGLSRSCLTRETGKNSDTLDSFFTLKLDIQGESVHSVSDALQRLNVSETLHDIDGGKIQGQRRMFFDVIPPVLIMHLKLFQYSDGNGKKIQKKIDFDVDLTIPKETLSRVGKMKYMSPKSRSYKLFGVVNHHGQKMNDGHYTSDVYLPIASGWLHFDDSEVYAVHEKHVLQHSDRHMPYLLFYRRMDVS